MMKSEMAFKRNKSKIKIIDEAKERMRVLNEQYERLRADEKAWEQELKERQELDGTIMDGLE